MKKIVFLLGICALVVGCSGGVVRPKIEDGIKAALPDYIGPAKSYDVTVAGDELAMLQGKMAKVVIDGQQVQAAPDLVIAKLWVEMREVRFNTKTRTLKSVDSTDIRATIAEGAMNHYIEESRGSSDLSLTLEADKILVHFKPTIRGYGVPLTISGKAEIVGGDKVNFKADAASLGRLPVPAYVVNKGLDLLNPVIDLSVMKFPVTLKEIRIVKGAAEVDGSAIFKF